MDDIIEKLKALERTVEQRKMMRERAEAKLETYMAQLKDMFDVNNLDEAQDLLEKLKTEADTLERKMVDEYSKLKEMVSEQ